jgi:hypothetical protein
VTAERVRRYLLPAWVAYSVLWVLYWGYVATLGGGIASGVQVVSMVLSGLGAAIGLLLGWTLRRER